MSRTASFSPVIYICAAAFSLITVACSCQKPAREAGKVSPIAAVRFTGVKQSSPYVCKHMGMAFRNVFRDKKRAVLVFFSLFTGLTVFLVIYTIFSHPNWEYSAIVDAPYDFCLSDATVARLTDPNSAQIDTALMEQICSLKGVTAREIVYSAVGNVDAHAPVWQPYMQDKLQVSSIAETDLASAPSIDTAGISPELLLTFPLAAGDYDDASLQAFVNGGAVYLSPTETEQIPQGLVGQTIQIKNTMTGTDTAYTIAGILKPLSVREWKDGENFYYNFGTIRDTGVVSEHGRHRIAHVYMSLAGIKKITPQPVIGQLFLDVEPTAEPSVRQTLTALQANSPKLYLLCQSTYIETNRLSLGAIMVIGTVFSFLLLLVGLLNFVNTMTTNVYSRQPEFATLESIGMTKKQILKTLSMEGGYYAFFSLALLILIGIPLTYGILSLVREQFYFLTFRAPVLAVAAISCLVILICLLVPRNTYRRIAKGSIANRLRRLE